MQESKLIRSLKALDNKLRQRFRTYVNSPYFNQHKKTIELLDYILKNLNGRPKKLGRELVFKHLYPGESYTEQAVFNTMSSLKKLFHSFLQRNKNITLVNAMSICEGVITRQRITDVLN